MLVTLDYQSPRMELRHLRYFVAVAEELSFRKAAQRLNISRPALSKQVKDLEDEIAVKLLDRDTVSVSLTKAGELFLEDSQKLLVLAEQAIERANQAQSGHRGKLRIGSVGIIATDFLPKTLKIFHQKYPGVEVAFVEMLPAEQLDALAQGRIDIGFAYGKEVLNITSLRSLCVVHSYLRSRRVQPASARRPKGSHPQGNPRGNAAVPRRRRALQPPRDDLPVLYRRGTPARARSARWKASTRWSRSSRRTRASPCFPTRWISPIRASSSSPSSATKADLDFHMWAVWQRHLPSHHIKHFVQLLEERVNGQELEKSQSVIAS